MAKLIATNPPGERTLTIELMERELGTIVAALGMTSHFQRSRHAEMISVKSLEYPQQSHRLFSELNLMLKGDGN